MFKRGRRKKEKSFVVTTVREILVTSDLEPLPSFSSQAYFYKTAYLIRRNNIDLVSRHYASNVFINDFLHITMIPILLRTLQIFKMILTMKKILHDFTRTYQPSPPPPSPETTFSYCLYLRNKSYNLGARLPKVTFRYQCFIIKSNLIKNGRAGLSRIELMSL